MGKKFMDFVFLENFQDFMIYNYINNICDDFIFIFLYMQNFVVIEFKNIWFDVFRLYMYVVRKWEMFDIR